MEVMMGTATTTPTMTMNINGYEDVTNFADEILDRLGSSQNCTEQSPSSSISGSDSGHHGNDAPVKVCDVGVGVDADVEEDDTSSVEGDLEAVDKLNVAYDFSSWNSFRASLPSEKQQALRTSYANSKKLSFGAPLSSFYEADGDEGIDEGSDEDEEDFFSKMTFSEEGEENDDGNCDGPEIVTRAKTEPTWFADVMTSLKLTEEERFDNAAWRMRLEVDAVFNKTYAPKKWEMEEMDAIKKFLLLQNPVSHPEYLNAPWQKSTRTAISTIFYPPYDDIQSVLLKRGPVLVDGEERELMMFTNGFVLSRVELDTLVNILLDASAGRMTKHRRSSLLTSEEMNERFREIDTDQDGSLDRTEIRDYFRSMGIALSKSSLDGLMTRFDSDSDGTISMDEFKAMMGELQGNKQDEGCNFWRGLGEKLKRVISNKGVTRKLEVAFQMSDIERVEKMADCQTKERSKFVDSELATLSFAVYLKNIADPMVILCSKPAHVEAWVEAFRICTTHALENVDCGAGESKRDKRRNPRQASWRCSTIDWGLDDSEADEFAFSKSDYDNYNVSTVDWG